MVYNVGIKLIAIGFVSKVCVVDCLLVESIVLLDPTSIKHPTSLQNTMCGRAHLVREGIWLCGLSIGFIFRGCGLINSCLYLDQVGHLLNDLKIFDNII